MEDAAVKGRLIFILDAAGHKRAVEKHLWLE